MSSSKHTTKLEMETLEGRLLPARTVFALDFTPDYRNMGSLYSTFFNVRNSAGYSPRFLDFNGDNRITPTDVNLAANAITSMVRSHYRSYLGMNLSIVGGDVTQQTHWGHRWLSYGLQNATHVSVIYLGGRSVGGEFGRAPIAQRGYNVEGFGEVYVRTIAYHLWNRDARATPADFARQVASTTAHELGHMMGLAHAYSGPRENLMLPSRQRTNNYFVNQAVRTDRGVQNAHHELVYSFRGQRSFYQVVSRGVPDTAGHDHSHGEESAFHTMQEAPETAAPSIFNLAVDAPTLSFDVHAGFASLKKPESTMTITATPGFLARTVAIPVAPPQKIAHRNLASSPSLPLTNARVDLAGLDAAFAKLGS